MPVLSAERSSDPIRMAHTGVVIASLLLCPLKIADGAEHTFYAGKTHYQTKCSLSGTLVSSDIGFLRENVRRGCYELFLASPGGDVDTALALGRIIRNAQMSVRVP